MDDSKIVVDIEKTHLKDVLQYCKPKEQLVLLRKFGILTGKETPLQRIWKDYNLTRERVRQIESQALMRFRRLIVGNKKYTTVLDEAKKILLSVGGLLQEDELVAKLINKKMFEFSPQELKLILVSDFDVNYLKRNRRIDKCFYVDNLFEDLLTSIVIYMNNVFKKSDDSIDIYEFIEMLKDQFVRKYDEVESLKNDMFYVNFFKVVRGIKTFDWRIGDEKDATVNPKTIRLKILYTMRKIAKPIHYQELPDKILERFPQKSVKLNTVHNELVKNNDIFVNLGLGIYGLVERWYKWWTVQTIIVRIFKATNRQMTVKEISKELLKEKMVSPNTILLNLQKYKNIFERVDKWIYKLKENLNDMTEDEIKDYAEKSK